MTFIDAVIGMPLLPSGIHTPDNTVLAILLLLFIITGFNTPYIAHVVSSFFADLISNRERNKFSGIRTATDARTILLLMFQTSVLEGILLSGCMTNSCGGTFYLRNVAILVAAALGFNVFSVAACMVLGFTFNTTPNALRWRNVHNSSQGIMGIFLLIPAAGSVLNPESGPWPYISGCILYVAMRICYIYKGIMIFFEDKLSLFYFILYLCALEIIPVIVIGRIALMLS